jgi:hypothetical protein
LVTINFKNQRQDPHKQHGEAREEMANNVLRGSGLVYFKVCAEGLPNALPAT